MIPEYFSQRENVINIEGIWPILEVTGLDKNPQVIEELRRDFNYDVKRPPGAVPFETGVALQNYLAKYLYPDLPKAAALWKLGRVTFEGYRRSLVGKVMLAAMPIWGPHRAIKNAPRIYDMTMRYGVRTVKQTGPNKYELRHQNDPGNIELLAGNLEAGIEATGAKNVCVKIRTLASDDHILEVEWDEQPK